MQLILVEQIRIYDLLFAMLRIQDPTIAEAIFNKHSEFELLGPMPFKEEEE